MADIIVGISDLQYPYTDMKAVNNVLTFLKYLKPDGLACVGDELDAPQPSRWNKGSAGEYSGTLREDIYGCSELLADLSKAAGKRAWKKISRSNHGDRIRTYVNRYAPALSEFEELRIENLLGYEKAGYEYLTQPEFVAPGFLMGHGDEGSLIQTPGSTALNIALKYGESFMGGHTHRLGLVPRTIGKRVIYGFEIGHLMDQKQASYLKGGYANWQQGFGVLYVDGKNVTPVPIPIHPDGSFVFDRKRFG